MLVDLKGKVGSELIEGEMLPVGGNVAREEALSALVTLGFAKAKVEKVLDAILKENGALTVEDIIKSALKRL